VVHRRWRAGVILDTGLGGTSAAWRFLQAVVARFTRLCSYDRAGMGYSDFRPVAEDSTSHCERTGRTPRPQRDWRTGGTRRAVDRGFQRRIFASDHPQRVAGLVLVDASHEDQAHEIPRVARFIPLLSALGFFRLLGVSFGLPVESLAPSARQFARNPFPCSGIPGRRRTKSCIFARARRRSEARAARSPFPWSLLPVHQEPTRHGDSCNAIKSRCRFVDIESSPISPVTSYQLINRKS
jgi:pimeloyl-ACP methyl ester carboxylesterase